MIPSVYILTPTTDEARAWFDESVQAEPWQRFGRGITVEHRYVQDILVGLEEAGLQGQVQVTS